MSGSETWLSYPDAPRIRTPLPGPRSRELLAEQARLETDAVVYAKYFPIAIANAQGSTVEDVDGNRFIDWVAGVSVLNLGHRHPALAAALADQAGKVWHALELPTEARLAFLRAFVDVLPGKLRGHARVLFTVTGGDAVETAVNLADYAKGRHGTVTFSGAYHGVHGGAANLTSGRRYHRTTSFHGGHVVRVPFPDPYRPLLGSAGDLTNATIRYLEHLVNDPHSGVDELSSVLVEPILGEGGYVVPPDDFLPALREFCDSHDLLLIADEVQTGLGRTGAMWAVDHAKVTPDILCVAKTIGGGLPVSMVAYRDDLVPSLPPGFHLGTYRGNPLGLAVGTAVLGVLTSTDVVARTERRGRRLLERFRTVQATDPAIGDVRGRGFMVGIEFVRSATDKEPWTDRAKAMRHELFERGVLMHTCGAFDHVLRFMAPLTIEDELLERGLARFAEASVALSAGPTGPARVAAPVAGPRPSPPPSIPLPPSPPISPGSPPPGRTLP
ncbi:MAG: aspartate aminotransferase family protein [Thermoplasmata archaeon]|jgi:4-aminobutyrate aminotransferase-like enzyme|nr:aspartate aminotransferase family protein [Thermoplasmata archaeon]